MFCGEECMESEIEGRADDGIKEGRIIGSMHICIDCLEELREALGINDLEQHIGEVEYEIYDKTAGP
jgi:hypothetical protein